MDAKNDPRPYRARGERVSDMIRFARPQARVYARRVSPHLCGGATKSTQIGAGTWMTLRV